MSSPRKFLLTHLIQARLFGFYDTSSDQDQTFLNLQLPSWDRELKTRWLEKFGIDDTPFPYNDILKVTSQGFPNEVPDQPQSMGLNL